MSEAHRRAASLLLIDVGNTRVKWAVARNGRLGTQRAADYARWSDAEFARRLLAGAAGVEEVMVASVAGRRVDARLRRALRRVPGLTLRFVASGASAAGVRNGYPEPWRLGVDRWVASIGGWYLERCARPVCIVDVGTALTVDLVDARGRHLGGQIVPGPGLMVSSLLRGTSGIRRRARGAVPRAPRPFARNTRAALESGGAYAAAATADRALREARRLLGPRTRLLLTGGGATRIAPLLVSPHRLVPDLVLRGLVAIATDGDT